MIGPTTVAGAKLGYRTPGEKEFHFVTMNVVFRKTYEGTIPAEAITPAGIEFFVEAQDSAGGRACAPNGFPCVTYSASVVPWPNPAVFLTQCQTLPRVGKDYRVQANVLDRPPTAKAQLVWRVAGTGEFTRVPMQNVFCDSFEAVVPAAQVTPAGIEYYVEVSNPEGAKWTAPAAGAAGPRKELPDTTPPSVVAGVKVEVVGPYEIAVSWPQATDNDTIAGYEVFRGSARDFPLGKDSLLATTFKTECFDYRIHAGQTYWYAVRARDASGNTSANAESVSVAVPKYPPPTAPEHVRTVAGRGKIKLAWKAMELPVVGYNIYRTGPGGKPALLNVRGPLPQATYIDAGLKDTAPHSYTIRAVDRGGQEGESSRPVAVAALPRIEGPAFALHFENSPDAESGLKGKLVGKAAYAPGVVGQALDLRGGGWLTFAHDDVFDLSGELTLEAWVKFDSLDDMPVFLSHGQWRERGFFVQAISHTLRYSLGGVNDCDGGQLETGKWYYVVCTYDLKDMRVYLNGREIHRCEAPEVDFTPWVGPFYVGRYTLEGKPYEVPGLIDEVKIYQRARTGEEIQKEYEAVSVKMSAGK